MMLKKLVMLSAIAIATLFVILALKATPVIASAGQTSSCTSCHSQSSTINITTDLPTRTVSPGQSFQVNISWSGGTSGRREVNWPTNAVSNTLFSPTPRIPYSSSAASGTTSSTLTAPATTGTYTVRVFIARGSPRDSDYADVTVTVAAANAAPVLGTIGNKSVTSGQLLQFTVSATDANGGTLTYSATSLPAGATFNASTRTFSWTPAAAGTYSNIIFQVSDGSLTDSETISITVNAANVAPILATIGSKSVTSGQLLQFTVSATDANGNTLTYSATGLPAGATFNASTRTFSWTPATAGTYSNIAFQVSDGSLTDSETISITVTAANVAPILATIGGKSVTAGQLLQFAISATDANGNTLTYSATGLPAGSTFNASTRTFSWTPASAGTYSNITFQVSDGSLTDTETISITVNAANVAPILATIGNKSVTSGQLLQFTVSATDANGGTLTYSATGLPAGADFNPATRNFTWTPAVGQPGSYANITFQVSDGARTDSESITITVNAVNEAPALGAIGNRTVNAGELLQFTVYATDPNNNPLAYYAAGLPLGATFNPETGAFSWMPTAEQYGVYPNVVFHVSDGSLTDLESITITVNEVNAPPVLNPIGSRKVTAGELLQFTINATDANSNPLTVSTKSLPPGANFSSATRTFSWMPAREQAGTYNVVFQVTDGKLTASESVTIIIEQADVAAPVLGPPATSEIEPNSIVIRWTTDEPSTSQVEYWASPHKLSPMDNNYVTNHIVRLTDLEAGATYRYTTLSRDMAGNLSVSTEYNFATPAAFSVSGLTVTPSEAKIGDTVTIGALVTSNTASTATYELLLKVAGATVATKTIDLAPREQKTVTFTTTRYAAGKALVDIHGAVGSLLVYPSIPRTNNSLPVGILAGILLLGGVCGLAGWRLFRRWTR
ncbi:MAG: putative Ig domain-containing protein [Dehalococcoidales bacterium]|nr:putative Ig domain-containing protein [Dehalococcoidales bacterium]